MLLLPALLIKPIALPRLQVRCLFCDELASVQGPAVHRRDRFCSADCMEVGRPVRVVGCFASFCGATLALRYDGLYATYSKNYNENACLIIIIDHSELQVKFGIRATGFVPVHKFAFLCMFAVRQCAHVGYGYGYEYERGDSFAKR